MTKTALVGSNVLLLNVRKCTQLLSLLTLLLATSMQLAANDLLAINIRNTKLPGGVCINQVIIFSIYAVITLVKDARGE